MYQDITPLSWWKRWFGNPEWIFHLNQASPLTWVDDEGVWHRPNFNMKTDFGSIPRGLQRIPGFGKDDHLIPVLFHDDGYLQHGGWVSYDGVTWIFEQMPRDVVDHRLYTMLRNDPGPFGKATVATAHTYLKAVETFGGIPWSKHIERQEESRNWRK